MIVGLIKKLSKENSILNTKSFYPQSKNQNNILRKLRLFNERSYGNFNKVEESNVHRFIVKAINTHDSEAFLGNYKYININNQGKHEDSWRAMVIYTDCKFSLKNNIITIIANHPSDIKLKCITKIWFTKD